MEWHVNTMHIKGFDWTSYVLELANRPSYCNITVKNKESQSMQISMSASNWNLVFFFPFSDQYNKKKIVSVLCILLYVICIIIIVFFIRKTTFQFVSCFFTIFRCLLSSFKLWCFSYYLLVWKRGESKFEIKFEIGAKL